MGKQAKWTSVEITPVAQLHGKKETEKEPLFLVTQWDGTQLCSHLTFCCEKKLWGGHGKKKDLWNSDIKSQATNDALNFQVAFTYTGNSINPLYLLSLIINILK